MGLFRMARRVFYVFLVTLPLLYGGAEVAAKKLAEKSLAENVKSHDPVATETSASVSSPLLFGLFTKKTIDRVEVSANHVKLEQLLADDATVTLHGVHIDVAQSMKQSEPVISSIDRMDVTFSISQDEVSKLVPTGLRVQFAGQGVTNLVGPGFLVKGTLEVEGGALAFRPLTPLPKGVRNLRIPLGETVASCIQNIEVQVGKAIITCSKDNPPTSFPGFPGKTFGSN